MYSASKLSPSSDCSYISRVQASDLLDNRLVSVAGITSRPTSSVASYRFHGLTVINRVFLPNIAITVFVAVSHDTAQAFNGNFYHVAYSFPCFLERLINQSM